MTSITLAAETSKRFLREKIDLGEGLAMLGKAKTVVLMAGDRKEVGILPTVRLQQVGNL